MKQAIKKAIEGGYGNHTSYKRHLDDETWRKQIEVITRGMIGRKNELLLDPAFWQALGKAEGWGEHPVWGKVGRDGYIDVWRSYWHDFIDHLALGKDADSFFTDLLSDKLKGK